MTARDRAIQRGVEIMRRDMEAAGEDLTNLSDADLSKLRLCLGTDSRAMVLNFLVNPQSNLDGRRPIDLLKAGQLKLVLDVARRVGIQGA